MTSAGKWVLGLLLLVVGAVFVARTVSSDPGSQAQVKLPSAETAGNATAKTDADKAKAAAEAAAKKVASTIAGDLACKKACVEVNEVANDAVTTAKLAPGSVTLSKLAFEVPNLNELENEINARKATEAALKAANADLKSAHAEAAANGAKNDAAITAAASNGITAEAAARSAADDALGKQLAAGDAALLGSLNKEMTDRAAADDVLQGKLNTEISDRAGAIRNLKGELANPNQVASPILAVNNNEIVANAVTTDKILDRTILAVDLAVGAVTTTEILNRTVLAEDLSAAAVVGRAAGETLTNVKVQSLRGQRVDNVGTAVSAGDLAVGTITGEVAPLAGPATGNLALGTVGTANLADGQITLPKLASDTVALLKDLRDDLEQEIDDREADVDEEEDARTAADAKLTTDLDKEIADRAAGDSALRTALTAEIAARTLADTALQTALNDEIAARAAGDSALQTALNDEIAARIAAIAAEVTARNSAIATAVGTLESTLKNAGTINTNTNPVDWTKLKNVPNDFADGVDNDGGGKVTDLKNELDGTAGDSAPNDASDPVSWNKIKEIPGGILDQTAKKVECTVACISNAELEGLITADKLAGGISGSQIADGTITADDLAGRNDNPGTVGVDETIVGAVTSEKIKDGTIEGRDLSAGAVDFSKLDTVLAGRITLVEDKVTALEQQFTDLADATKTTPAVATQHLAGAKTLIALAGGASASPIAPGGTETITLTVPDITSADIFTVQPSLGLPAGVLVAKAVVPAAGGTVEVAVYNATGAAMPIASTTWQVSWIDITT